MKKIFLLITFYIINLYPAYNQTTDDSCLKMISDNDYLLHPDGYHVGGYNPDSVRVDSCIGSPTYGKLFAKRYFYLQFQPNYYPFDNVLNPDTIKTVSDISSLKPDLKLRFEQLEVQLGMIYFQGLINEVDDSTFFLNPVIRIFFSDYQYIDGILDTFLSEIDTLRNIIYENQFGWPTIIPSDVAMDQNIPISNIFLNWKKDRDYWLHSWYEFYPSNWQPFGFQSAIYEMNCPLAWEVSKGVSSTVLSISDSWDNNSEHPDVLQNHIQPIFNTICSYKRVK